MIKLWHVKDMAACNVYMYAGYCALHKITMTGVFCSQTTITY